MADSFVVVGAGMLMLWMLIDLVREIKAEKAQNAAVVESNSDTKSESEENE